MGSVEDAHWTDTLWVCSLETLPYRDAVELEERIRAERLAERLPDTLLGIEVLDSDRGGRVTYHAPGQLVGYPIMRIGDVGTHLRAIESSLIEALASVGVAARSRCSEGPDYTGVWVAERKIASIGVHVSRGISTHGFAVNVDLDL